MGTEYWTPTPEVYSLVASKLYFEGWSFEEAKAAGNLNYTFISGTYTFSRYHTVADVLAHENPFLVTPGGAVLPSTFFYQALSRAFYASVTSFWLAPLEATDDVLAQYVLIYDTVEQFPFMIIAFIQEIDVTYGLSGDPDYSFGSAMFLEFILRDQI